MQSEKVILRLSSESTHEIFASINNRPVFEIQGGTQIAFLGIFQPELQCAKNTRIFSKYSISSLGIARYTWYVLTVCSNPSSLPVCGSIPTTFHTIDTVNAEGPTGPEHWQYTTRDVTNRVLRQVLDSRARNIRLNVVTPTHKIDDIDMDTIFERPISITHPEVNEPEVCTYVPARSL